MSEQILLLNPRHKHKRRTNRRTRRARRGRGMPAGLRKYWAARGRASNRRHTKRRRPRRHLARASNRRRVLRTGSHYLSRKRRTNRRHHGVRHRRRHSNPRHFRMPGMGSARGLINGYVMPMAIAGLGGFAMDLAWGFVGPKLPTSLQTGYAAMAAKLAVVLGIAFGVNKLRPGWRAQTNVAVIGAGGILFYGMWKGLGQSVLPASTPGLHGYIDYQSYALPGAGRLHGYMASVPRGLGSLEDLYSPAAVIQPPGMAVPRQFGALRGYIAAQPHMSTGGGLMGYDWQNDGM
jgi:hypothetical protein